MAVLKVAVLGEDEADEAAIRILVEAVLGEPTERADKFPLRSRGWTSAINILPKLLLHFEYNAHADLFVIVVDSDESPIHFVDHEYPGRSVSDCRVCRIREIYRDFDVLIRKRRHAPPHLRIAVGLAIPAAEAWYLSGIENHVSEAAWLQHLQGAPPPYTKERLKQLAYGTMRPGRQALIQKAEMHATRLAEDLTLLEQFFPNGFGYFARAVRATRHEQASADE